MTRRVHLAILIAASVALLAAAPVAAARRQTVQVSATAISQRLQLTVRLPSGLALVRRFVVVNGAPEPGVRGSRTTCPRGMSVPTCVTGFSV